MPAKSKSQQRLFGMVHAYQKGKLKHAPESVREIARSISDEDAEHFAKTKHKGLPEKKAYMQGFMDKCAEFGMTKEARNLNPAGKLGVKDLIKAKILAHLRRARKGGGTDPADGVKKEKINWHRKKKHLLFQGMPHYFVETTGGKIPPELIREEKQASAKIDIPALYEEVRRAYADMGYPVSGDRLFVSEQPTYTNGKAVPADVISPNESGGNTQADGTVRINPLYRSVMRHWGLKGSGRDFLRLIIGHELGHHIDKSVLSKPEHAEERKRLLREIAKAKFHTVYTDSYGPDTDPRKLDKELLAEYLADMVRRKMNQSENSAIK